MIQRELHAGGFSLVQLPVVHNHLLHPGEVVITAQSSDCLSVGHHISIYDGTQYGSTN